MGIRKVAFGAALWVASRPLRCEWSRGDKKQEDLEDQCVRIRSEKYYESFAESRLSIRSFRHLMRSLGIGTFSKIASC